MKINPHLSYSATLRMAMNTRENRQGRTVGKRELAARTGVTYETIRRLYIGPKQAPGKAGLILGTAANRFSISEPLNEAICEYLGLNVDQMWEKAEREKVSQKLGYLPMQLEDPKGQMMGEYWPTLDDEQRDVLLRMAQGFVAEIAHA